MNDVLQLLREIAAWKCAKRTPKSPAPCLHCRAKACLEEIRLITGTKVDR